MRSSVWTPIVVCVVALTTTIQADEIHFKNGDRLSGEILRLTEGKLVLKSETAGEVTLNLADIQTFSSESALSIHLKDGTVLHQPVVAAQPDEFAIEEGEPLRAQTFPLAQIASINPPAKPKPKWTGSVSGSVASTHGNTKADSVTGSLSIARRSEKDRTTVTADYARTEQEDRVTGQDETIENWWRATAKYDYFFTKKLFGFVNGRYEKDDVSELDRRIIVGGGVGYQWVEREDLAFSTSGGLASLYEKFDNVDDSNSELSLQLGYDLNKTLWHNLKLLHDLTYYPSLEKFSDYYLTSTAELRATMIENLFASFRVMFNYDATPAPGQGKTDVKYLLGVGLSF
jgi:putative salt-induced outer membrane protein YdiY